MSTMAVASRRSALNPNAPLFIPAAFQRVEDFSPQWWDLVKTSTWFRDHWFHQHQEQETFDGEDEDVINLLPDSFDIDIADEFSGLDAVLEEATFQQTAFAEDDLLSAALNNEKSGFEIDAEAFIKNLSLQSPRNGGVRHVMEPFKYHREKPPQCVSPKFSPRRIIHQPR